MSKKKTPAPAEAADVVALGITPETHPEGEDRVAAENAARLEALRAKG